MSLKDKFEVYTLTSNYIREGLKQKLKGYIRVGVDADSDTLEIQIINGDFDFHYNHHHWLTYSAMGNGLDKIIDEVMSMYRKELMKKYFY